VSKGRKRTGPGEASLPIDPGTLRERFPSLTEDDVAAYAEVTRRLLGDPDRAEVSRRLLATAREARNRDQATLTPEQRAALRYLVALEKMQGGTGRERGH
jgi:hypothetical protein